MNRFISLLIIVLVGGLQVAVAQAPGMGMGMGAGPGGMDDRFYTTAPDIGEMVQDLDIVDDQGNPVNVRELATGQYTVLVLGCLT